MRKITTEEFIEKAKEEHGGRYDYSLVDYKTTHSKVKIICPDHGVFEQQPANHLQGFNCRLCGLVEQGKNFSNNIRENKTVPKHLTPPLGAKLIPLTGDRYAIVDDEDYERVMQYNWQGEFYAKSDINGKGVLMHRFIMGVTDPKIHVDHKFHNTLDNRKSQLRVCTQSKNMMNSKPQKNSSSKYKGVCWDKSRNKWVVSISVSFRCSKHLGRYSTELEAAHAYDQAAKQYYGEFAYLNFPEEVINE